MKPSNQNMYPETKREYFGESLPLVCYDDSQVDPYVRTRTRHSALKVAPNPVQMGFFEEWNVLLQEHGFRGALEQVTRLDHATNKPARAELVRSHLLTLLSAQQISQLECFEFIRRLDEQLPGFCP